MGIEMIEENLKEMERRSTGMRYWSWVELGDGTWHTLPPDPHVLEDRRLERARPIVPKPLGGNVRQVVSTNAVLTRLLALDALATEYASRTGKHPTTTRLRELLDLSSAQFRSYFLGEATPSHSDLINRLHVASHGTLTPRTWDIE